MQRWVLQQEFPNWDSLRIMNSRATTSSGCTGTSPNRVVTGSELLAEIDGEGGDVGSSGDAVDSVSAGIEPGRPGPTRRK